VKTILIVEDDELNLKLFSDLLQSHGFKTLESADGHNTMQLAREHHPDLILMDIQLPEVSGMDHTKTLKADPDLKDIPILAVTAFAMKGDKEMILAAGCDGYIAKPISVPHFLGEIKRFLTLAPFRLIDALITGHPEIDASHERLAALLNEMMDLMGVGDDARCVEKFKEIDLAIKTHFLHEERVMEELQYDALEAHKAEHVSVIDTFERLMQNAETEGYGGELPNKLTSILVQDMIRADLDFKKFLEGIGYRP
jgi:two-component system, cell cycle response regulator DivK